MIKDDLVRLNAIKFGDFTLTSGKKSSYYVDIKAAETDPDFLKELAEEISKKVSAKKVGGVELGAVPLVIATALRMGIPYLIIRKQENMHGTRGPFIGSVKEGDRIDIIEDVVTTGNSILRAVKTLRERGAIVERAICIVDREEGGSKLLSDNGIELLALVRISEVMEKKL